MYPPRTLAERNSLFSRNIENDVLQAQSPLLLGNRSSSSADSTSPESYPDMFAFSSMSPLSSIRMNMFNRSPEVNDTPLSVRTQRPIIGRKILGSTNYASSTDLQPKTFDNSLDSHHSPWQNDYSLFSNTASSSNTFMEHNRNYELFPSKTSLQSATPVNTSPYTPLSNISPTASYSSLNSLLNYPRSPTSSFNLTPRCTQTNLQANAVGNGQKMCTFCRKNGETPLVYMTHKVKERIGNRFVVTCPILSSHVCIQCGATGSDAHTITYCPVLRRDNNGMPLKSTTVTLKNTRIKSNGRRRY